MIDVIIGGAILGALFSLIAVGLNLQYGVTRILNIAHGEFLVIGAYVTYILFTYYGVNPMLSLVISGPTVFLIGVFLQVSVFRKLIHLSKSAEELEFRSLLVCFGLQFIIQNLIRSRFGTAPIGAPYLMETVSILGEKFQINRIVAAIIAVAISVALYFLLRSTKAGLAMRAAVEEPTGAQLVGVNILKIHALSFGLGALTSALAGSMYSMIEPTINPYAGSRFTFIALAVIILGGMGSFVGSLLGGFFIGYLNYITLKMDPLITMAVVYAFIVIMLIIKPKGLLGR
ncbi:MAG: branched-chain amino acid ABC transporter permease [Candidatus Bathyarchaeia archaeon]